eukprot:sb/3462023/
MPIEEIPTDLIPVRSDDQITTEEDEVPVSISVDMAESSLSGPVKGDISDIMDERKESMDESNSMILGRGNESGCIIGGVDEGKKIESDPNVDDTGSFNIKDATFEEDSKQGTASEVVEKEEEEDVVELDSFKETTVQQKVTEKQITKVTEDATGELSDKEEDSLPAFRYPTQAQTQFQAPPEDLFSQWTDEYWSKLNEKLNEFTATKSGASETSSSKPESCRKELEKPERPVLVSVENLQNSPITSRKKEPDVSLPNKPAELKSSNKKLPSGKQKRSIFGTEDFSDLKLATTTKSAGGLFAGEDLSDLDLTKGFGGFQSASSNFSMPSKPAGFSTASGKNVSVSKSALEAIRSSQLPSDTKKSSSSIFSEDFSDLDQLNLPSQSGFKSASSKLTAPSFGGGFSTASGKNVPVSETALNHIRSSQIPEKPSDTKKSSSNIFTEDFSDLDQLNLPSQGGFKSASSKLGSGFSTASGKNVAVSETALNRIRSSQIPEKPETSFGGFATASGKNVSVSDESLNHIRSSQLPSDNSIQLGKIGTLKPQTTGFSTASGKNVGVSESSLRHIRSSQQVVSGFSTVGKKPVLPDKTVTPVRPQSSISRTSSAQRPATTTASSNVTPVRTLGGFSTPQAVGSSRSTPASAVPIVSEKTRKPAEPITGPLRKRRVIAEEPTDQGSFITPYNKNNPAPQPANPAHPSSKSLLWGTGISDPDSFIKHSNAAQNSTTTVQPPAHFTTEELFELGVSAGAEEITPGNSESFRFSRPDYFTLTQSSSVPIPGCDVVLHLKDNCSAGMAEFRTAMLGLPKIRKGYLTEEWFANHFRLVVWKCAGQERSQPHSFAGHSLTPGNVMSQLLYR